MSGTRSRTVTQTYTWPHVVHWLIDRYLTDTGLQNAYDRVTLTAQRTSENENEYTDRISEAARDCAKVFEDHALVHVVYRSQALRLLRILTDQRRTRMGAGILRRNGDPGNYGLHVYDTRLTTDTMTMKPNVTTRDTPN